MNKNAIIFDLDDTIVHCEMNYGKTRKEFAEMIEFKTGFSQERTIRILSHIAAEEYSTNGISRIGQGRIYAATSAVVDSLMGNVPDILRMHDARKIAETVYSMEYPLRDGAYESLEKIQQKGYFMVLCTKGDEVCQRRKITDNGLDKFFPSDKVHIDRKKTAVHFNRIIGQYDLDRDNTISVGDSLVDDVGSAIGAGINSVYINGNSISHFVDSLRNDLPTPDFTIESLEELPHFLYTYFEDPM